MNNTVKTDVLIIGAGPSGLATAIHLADLFKRNNIDKQIIVVDKGQSIGSHILSGAVIKPQIFSELLPDVDVKDIPFDSKVVDDTIYMLSADNAIKVPIHPPYMGNQGNYCASLAEICRFLATKATEKGVDIYTGFSIQNILYDQNGNVSGAKCIDTGIDHNGNKLENYVEGTTIKAYITIFAEGTRGSLAKKLIKTKNLDNGKNPQIYSLGVKELWSVPEGTIKAGEVFHTMGFPASDSNIFGGGFIYGLKNNMVAIGLVLGLDYADPTVDIFKAFQIWKTHKFVSNILNGGRMVEYGAKTLPEGGFYSQPQYYTGGAMIVGDSAGFLAMPALKGIHLAISSGMSAAKAALSAFQQNDFSENSLSIYQKFVKKSAAYKELRRCRNFRQGFHKGMILGAFNFGTQLITGGAGFFGKLKIGKDSEYTKAVELLKKPLFIQKTENFEFDRVLTNDKANSVFYSSTMHDEQQVVHLKVNNEKTYSEINIPQYDAPCRYYCPADVYEIHTNRTTNKKELRIHGENCVHCKTCDIKEPVDGITWNVPNGGNGPDYKYM